MATVVNICKIIRITIITTIIVIGTIITALIINIIIINILIIINPNINTQSWDPMQWRSAYNLIP